MHIYHTNLGWSSGNYDKSVYFVDCYDHYSKPHRATAFAYYYVLLKKDSSIRTKKMERCTVNMLFSLSKEFNSDVAFGLQSHTGSKCANGLGFRVQEKFNAITDHSPTKDLHHNLRKTPPLTRSRPRSMLLL